MIITESIYSPGVMGQFRFPPYKLFVCWPFSRHILKRRTLKSLNINRTMERKKTPKYNALNKYGPDSRDGEVVRAFHLLPMWPGFESRRRRRHRMCVEFVVSSRLCLERVFPQAWFSHPLKHLFQILIRSELIWKMSPIRRSHVYQFLLSTVVCPVWYYNVSLIPPPWTTYNA